MIVVACHNVRDKDYIIPCLTTIQRVMPGAQVLIVDNASPLKDYIPKAQGLGVIVEEQSENLWEWGAFCYAYKSRPQEDFFCFIHDSTIAKSDFYAYRDRPLTVLGYMNKYDGCAESHKVRIPEIVQQVYGVPVPEEFAGVFGSMFFCRREVMDRLGPLVNFRVESRLDAQCMERVIGIGLQLAGYDVKGCALGLGEHVGQGRGPVQKFHGYRN